MRSFLLLVLVIAALGGCALPLPTDPVEPAGVAPPSSPESAESVIEFQMGTMVGYTIPGVGPGTVGSSGLPELVSIPFEEASSASITGHWNATTLAAQRFTLEIYEDGSGKIISSVTGISPLVLEIPPPIDSRYYVGIYAAEGSVTVDQSATLVISATR